VGHSADNDLKVSCIIFAHARLPIPFSLFFGMMLVLFAIAFMQ
jgi:hypothetical protein